MEAFPESLTLCEVTQRSRMDCPRKANDAELCCFLWCALEQTTERTIQMLVIWDSMTLIIVSLQWKKRLTISVYYFWTLPCYTRVFQYILVSSCTILRWNASFLFLNIWWYGYKDVIFKQNENVVDSPLPIYWLSDSISILWLYYWQEADVRTWWLIICRFSWHDITAGDVTAATAYLINEYSVIANWLHNLPIWAYFTNRN